MITKPRGQVHSFGETNQATGGGKGGDERPLAAEMAAVGRPNPSSRGDDLAQSQRLGKPRQVASKGTKRRGLVYHLFG